MILLAAAGAGACGGAGGCQPVPGSAPRGSTTVNGEPPLAVQSEPAAPQTRQVSIDNFTFSPTQLTVPAGSKVVWVNHDDVPHTVVSNDKAFASKALDTDDQFVHVFTAAGTYPYFCSVHPHMTGQIIVK
jgi:plastocyanin